MSNETRSIAILVNILHFIWGVMTMHGAYSRRNLNWKLDCLFPFLSCNQNFIKVEWTFEECGLTWLNFLYFGFLVFSLNFPFIYFQYWKSIVDWTLRFLLTYYQKKHLCGNWRCLSQLLLMPFHAFMLSKLRLWYFAGSFSLTLYILNLS